MKLRHFSENWLSWSSHKHPLKVTTSILSTKRRRWRKKCLWRWSRRNPSCFLANSRSNFWLNPSLKSWKPPKAYYKTFQGRSTTWEASIDQPSWSWETSSLCNPSISSIFSTSKRTVSTAVSSCKTPENHKSPPLARSISTKNPAESRKMTAYWLKDNDFFDYQWSYKANL